MNRKYTNYYKKKKDKDLRDVLNKKWNYGQDASESTWHRHTFNKTYRDNRIRLNQKQGDLSQVRVKTLDEIKKEKQQQSLSKTTTCPTTHLISGNQPSYKVTHSGGQFSYKVKSLDEIRNEKHRKSSVTRNTSLKSHTSTCSVNRCSSTQPKCIQEKKSASLSNAVKEPVVSQPQPKNIDNNLVSEKKNIVKVGSKPFKNVIIKTEPEDSPPKGAATDSSSADLGSSLSDEVGVSQIQHPIVSVLGSSLSDEVGASQIQYPIAQKDENNNNGSVISKTGTYLGACQKLTISVTSNSRVVHSSDDEDPVDGFKVPTLPSKIVRLPMGKVKMITKSPESASKTSAVGFDSIQIFPNVCPMASKPTLPSTAFTGRVWVPKPWRNENRSPTAKERQEYNDKLSNLRRIKQDCRVKTITKSTENEKRNIKPSQSSESMGSVDAGQLSCLVKTETVVSSSFTESDQLLTVDPCVKFPLDEGVQLSPPLETSTPENKLSPCPSLPKLNIDSKLHYKSTGPTCQPTPETESSSPRKESLFKQTMPSPQKQTDTPTKEDEYTPSKWTLKAISNNSVKFSRLENQSSDDSDDENDINFEMSSKSDYCGQSSDDLDVVDDVDNDAMMDMYFTEDDAISLFAPDMDDLFKDTSVVQDASKKRVLFSDRGQKEASSHYNNNNIKKNYCSVKVEKDQHSKFEEPEQSVSSLDNSEIIIRNRNTDNSTAPCVSDRTSKKRKREENNDHSVKKQRFGNKTIDNKVQTKGNTNNPGNQTPTFIKTYKPLVYRASIDTYLVENKPGEAWRVLKTAPLCLQSDVHLLDQILQRCETAKDPDIKQISLEVFKRITTFCDQVLPGYYMSLIKALSNAHAFSSAYYYCNELLKKTNVGHDEPRLITVLDDLSDQLLLECQWFFLHELVFLMIQSRITPNDNILMGLIRHHNHHGEYGRQWEVLKKCDTFDIVPGKNVINEIVQGLSKWNQEKKMMATAILHKHYPVFDNGASCVNNDIVNRGIRRPVSILGSPPNVHPRNAPPDVKQAVCSEAVRQNAAFGKDHGSPHKLPRRGYNRTEYHEKRSHSRPSVSYEAKYSSQVGRNSRNTDQCRQASRMSKNTDHFRRRGRTNREVDQCSQASRESKKMDQWSSVNGCDVSQSDTGYLSYGDNNKDMNDSLGKIDTRLDVHATKHYVETIKNTRHVADLAQTYHKISFENLNMMTNEVKRAFIKCLVREQETCGRKFLEFIKNIEKCYKTDLREDDKKILAFIAIGILCTCYDNNIWSEGFHLLYALHSYNIFYLHMVPYKDEMIFPANCMVTLMAMKICLKVQNPSNALEIIKASSWIIPKLNSETEKRLYPLVLVDLAKCFMQKNELGDAWMVLEQLGGTSPEYSNMAIYGKTINDLICQSVESVQFDNAMQIHKFMLTKKIPVRRQTMSIFLSRLHKEGRVTTAKALFMEANLDGFYPKQLPPYRPFKLIASLSRPEKKFIIEELLKDLVCFGLYTSQHENEDIDVVLCDEISHGVCVEMTGNVREAIQSFIDVLHYEIIPPLETLHPTKPNTPYLSISRESADAWIRKHVPQYSALVIDQQEKLEIEPDFEDIELDNQPFSPELADILDDDLLLEAGHCQMDDDDDEFRAPPLVVREYNHGIEDDHVVIPQDHQVYSISGQISLLPNSQPADEYRQYEPPQWHSGNSEDRLTCTSRPLILSPPPPPPRLPPSQHHRPPFPPRAIPGRPPLQPGPDRCQPARPSLFHDPVSSNSMGINLTVVSDNIRQDIFMQVQKYICQGDIPKAHLRKIVIDLHHQFLEDEYYRTKGKLQYNPDVSRRVERFVEHVACDRHWSHKPY